MKRLLFLPILFAVGCSFSPKPQPPVVAAPGTVGIAVQSLAQSGASIHGRPWQMAKVIEPRQAIGLGR